jgi:hypothetical protein
MHHVRPDLHRGAWGICLKFPGLVPRAHREKIPMLVGGGPICMQRTIGIRSPKPHRCYHSYCGDGRVGTHVAWSAHRVPMSTRPVPMRSVTRLMSAIGRQPFRFPQWCCMPGTTRWCRSTRGESLASLIPGAKFVPLDIANHILLEEDPAWTDFDAQLRGFLPTGRSWPVTPHRSSQLACSPTAKSRFSGSSPRARTTSRLRPPCT